MPIYYKNDATYNYRLVESFKFPGGEIQVRVDNFVEKFEPYTTIKAYLYSSDDIMTLLLTVDSLRRSLFNTRIKLIIPYFPYARQDRVCAPGEAFSLEVVANLINSLNAQEVIIYDPHSPKVGELIKNCRTITLMELLQEEGTIPKIFKKAKPAEKGVLVRPDEGAQNRFKLIVSLLHKNYFGVPFAMKKVRDPKTGKILHMELEPVDTRWIDGHPLWIFDDICDGGATFKMIADYFGGCKVNLVVTHGIFSNFENLKYFNKVYCVHTPHSKEQLPKNVVILGDGDEI